MFICWKKIDEHVWVKNTCFFLLLFVELLEWEGFLATFFPISFNIVSSSSAFVTGGGW